MAEAASGITPEQVQYNSGASLDPAGTSPEPSPATAPAGPLVLTAAAIRGSLLMTQSKLHKHSGLSKAMDTCGVISN